MTQDEERFIRLTGKPVEFDYFGKASSGFELPTGQLYVDDGILNDASWYINNEEYHTSVKYKQRLHTVDSIMEALGIIYKELQELRSIVDND